MKSTTDQLITPLINKTRTHTNAQDFPIIQHFLIQILTNFQERIPHDFGNNEYYPFPQIEGKEYDSSKLVIVGEWLNAVDSESKKKISQWVNSTALIYPETWEVRTVTSIALDLYNELIKYTETPTGTLKSIHLAMNSASGQAAIIAVALIKLLWQDPNNLIKQIITRGSALTKDDYFMLRSTTLKGMWLDKFHDHIIQSSSDNNSLNAREYAQKYNFKKIPENPFKQTLSNVSVMFLKDMEGYQTSINIKKKLLEGLVLLFSPGNQPTTSIINNAGFNDDVVDNDALSAIHGKKGNQIIHYSWDHDFLLRDKYGNIINNENADTITKNTIQSINYYA